MFLASKPSQRDIEIFLAQRENDVFSYVELGATEGIAPARYNVDHNRIQLGTGPDDFERARAAVCTWQMFAFDWVDLLPRDTPIEVGETVAIMVRHFGFYSLNAARIVYTLDEPRRFGFAYGTLSEHGEIGEERFSVEYDTDTDEVWYDLFAFSRPGSMLARLGYPLSRYLQKAFARDSKIAMLSAVANQ